MIKVKNFNLNLSINLSAYVKISVLKRHFPVTVSFIDELVMKTVL